MSVRPDAIVLLGGSSDIGGAILTEVCQDKQVVLAVRNTDDPALLERAELLRQQGAIDVHIIAFEATEGAAIDAALSSCFERFRVTEVIVGFGILGDHARALTNPEHAWEIAMIDYGAQVRAITCAYQLFLQQGGGTIVAFSSIAGWRPRKANFVYGSTKAGLDAFCQGLQDEAHGSGVNVIVVRPGFVIGSMTAGMEPAPLSVTPQEVAAAVVSAIRQGRSAVVWVPGSLRILAWVMRCVPRPLWRRMPR